MATTEAAGGEDDLTALTATMVKRMEGMFAPFRGTWDNEALIDYGLDFAREAVGKVELGKGQLSTFVCTVVKRRLLDKHRNQRREAKRVKEHGDLAKYLRQGRAFEDVDDSLPLAEWAGEIYRMAALTLGKRHTGRRGNGGSLGFEPAQEAVLLAIKWRLKLSDQAVISLLHDRKDIVSAIRLKRYPSREKIRRIRHRLDPTLANHRPSRHIRSYRMAADHISEKQAASLVSLSPGTLARWRRSKDVKWIRCFRPGGRVRYLKSEVVKWMNDQAVVPGEAGTN